jgi:hypothetical protein
MTIPTVEELKDEPPTEADDAAIWKFLREEARATRISTWAVTFTPEGHFFQAMLREPWDFNPLVEALRSAEQNRKDAFEVNRENRAHLDRIKELTEANERLQIKLDNPAVTTEDLKKLERAFELLRDIGGTELQARRIKELEGRVVALREALDDAVRAIYNERRTIPAEETRILAAHADTAPLASQLVAKIEAEAWNKACDACAKVSEDQAKLHNIWDPEHVKNMWTAEKCVKLKQPPSEAPKI